MTTHPFENLDPAQHVQVLPRHFCVNSVRVACMAPSAVRRWWSGDSSASRRCRSVPALGLRPEPACHWGSLPCHGIGTACADETIRMFEEEF